MTLPVGAVSRMAVVESPVGPVSIFVGAGGLVRRVRFESESESESDGGGGGGGGAGGGGGLGGGDAEVGAADLDDLAAAAAAELAEYFAGTRESFTMTPDWDRLDPVSARVLATLVGLARYGHTVSYGELAAAAGLGDPVAARVAGQILNGNPWPVLVPCHRVVMADGSLGGFGAGIWRKEVLLRHEGVLPATLFGL